MKDKKIYRFMIASYLILIVSVFIVIMGNADAQFTPAQNAYLNKNELLKNPDAENGAIGWATLIKPNIVTNDYFSGSQAFEFNLSNQTLSFCQIIDTSVKMQNALLGGSCRVKTTSNDVEICIVSNGVPTCSPVSNTGNWQKSATQNAIAGTTSGLCVKSSTPITGNVKIDNCTFKEEFESAGLGIIGIANGGTGLTTSGPAGYTLISDGTQWTLQLSESLPPSGLVGNVLRSNGTNWESSPLIDNVASINGLTSANQTIEIGSGGTNVSIISSGDTHTINIPEASATRSGKLSATDWNSFNSKLSGAGVSIDGEIALFQGTLGNQFKRSTGTGIARLTNGILDSVPVPPAGQVLTSNGTAWVAGSVASPTLDNANATTTGLLTFTDWIRFDGAANKPDASATARGFLTAADWIRFDYVSETPADAQTTGLLTSSDWVRFDSKANVGDVDLTGNITGVLDTVNGGTGLSAVGANNTFLKSDGTNLSWVTIPAPVLVNANSTTTGLLTSTDWIRFDGAANKPNASATVTGYLSATDWNTFNSKANVGTVDLTGTVIGQLPFTKVSGVLPVTRLSGVLPVSKGGTGLSTSGPIGSTLISDGTGWVIGSSSSGPSGLPPSGMTGNVLRSNGTDWESSPIIDNVASINNLTSTTQNIEVTANGSNVSITSSGDTHSINIPEASTTKSGKLSSTDWINFNSKIGGSGISVDGEIALFQGTLGNQLKRSVGTGIASLNNGVLGSIPVPVSGKVLISNGTSWVAGDAPSGGGGGSGATIYTSSQLSLTGGSAITLDSVSTIQQITVKGNSGPISLSSLPFGSSAPADGTQIRIIGADSSSTVELTNNDASKGVILNGNAVLKKYHVLTVIYSLGLDRYIETSRNF